MKVTLTIELELPDSITSDEAQEAIGYHYINYVSVKHASDAVEWCAKAKPDSPNEDAGAKVIYLHHDMWGDICSNAKWSISI